MNGPVLEFVGNVLVPHVPTTPPRKSRVASVPVVPPTGAVPSVPSSVQVRGAAGLWLCRFEFDSATSARADSLAMAARDAALFADSLLGFAPVACGIT